MPYGRTMMFLAERGCNEIYNALALKYRGMKLCSLGDIEKGPAGGRERPCPSKPELVLPKAELVLIDCGFSLEKGLAVLKKIKSADFSVPVIFIAESFRDNALEVFRAGARQFFVKPVHLPELEEIIKRLLSFKKNSREKRAPLYNSPTEPAPPESDKPINLIEVMHFIEKHLTDRLTLQELADRAGLSKYHFCRFFSKHTGMTPMKYVSLSRVERAKDMMISGNSTISSIAFKSGFNNATLFSKQFKKYTGQSPSIYRSFIRRKHLTWN
jgi:YesN/AraC family two-component response regulator